MREAARVAMLKGDNVSKSLFGLMGAQLMRKRKGNLEVPENVLFDLNFLSFWVE